MTRQRWPLVLNGLGTISKQNATIRWRQGVRTYLGFSSPFSQLPHGCLFALFYLALALFVGGYVLQFAGHILGGTDPGEIIYFKRKLGLPYVEFPPPRPTSGARSPAAVGDKNLIPEK